MAPHRYVRCDTNSLNSLLTSSTNKEEWEHSMYKLCMSTILDSGLGHKHKKIKVQKTNKQTNMQNRLFCRVKTCPYSIYRVDQFLATILEKQFNMSWLGWDYVGYMVSTWHFILYHEVRIEASGWCSVCRRFRSHVLCKNMKRKAGTNIEEQLMCEWTP